MDVDDLVGRWKTLVVGLALAPDKDTIDKHEAGLNDLLEPFLKCPVKQIREFCRKLVAAVQADPQIPWVVKNGVVGYIKIFVEKAQDTEVIDLKKEIAGRIARAVEGEIQPQLVEAVTNALCWRDPANLKRVEKAVESGKKAKLVGRESCLFLEIGDECVML